MRYLSEKRYDLIKSDCVCGAPARCEFGDRTYLLSPVGGGIPELEIYGSTLVDTSSSLESAKTPISVGDEDVSLISRGRNLFYNGYGYPTSNLYHYELWTHEIMTGDFRVTETGMRAQPREASSFHLRKTVYKKGTYTLSARADGLYRIVIVLLDKELSPISELDEQWEGWKYNSGYCGWWRSVNEAYVTFTIPSPAEYFKIGFVPMGSSMVNIDDIQLEYGNSATGYKKYAEKTGTIPSALLTANGDTISINLRSVGKKCDRLLLSWNKGTAKYIKAVDELSLDGAQWAREEYSGYVRFSCEAENAWGGAVCSLFPEGYKEELGDGESSFYADGGCIMLDTKNQELMQLSAEEIGKTLKEKGTVIFYEMAEPLEYELSADILSHLSPCLKLPVGNMGEDTFIEINSATPPQKTVISYNTAQRGDCFKLRVVCISEQGEKIGGEELNLRCGTLFTVKAPHIEGYRPITEKIDGVLSESKEIKFIYKKETENETL